VNQAVKNKVGRNRDVGRPVRAIPTDELKKLLEGNYYPRDRNKITRELKLRHV
jgi:hypothetical protein